MLDMDRIELAHKELQRISVWINNADTKAGILLALNGGLLTLFVSDLENAKNVLGYGVYEVIMLIFLGSLAYSVYCAIRVLLPDITIKSDKLLFFFGTIQEIPRNEFVRQFQTQSEVEITVELLDQVHVNATIATNKFQNLKSSIYALVMSVATVLLVILFLVMN